MSIAEKLTTVAANQRKVYDAGKQAEYDKFWNTFQYNGTRTKYTMYGFAGSNGGMNYATFYPKYDITPVGSAQYLFYGWVDNPVDTQPLNMRQRLEDCGVVLDVSQATNLSGLFGYGRFTETPAIDVTGLTTASTNLFFYNKSLVTIGTITTKESVTYSGWFGTLPALETISFEGAIGQNIDFSSSALLTYDSIMNIIDHLATKTSGTYTLTLGATNLAKLTDAEKAIATEKGWTLA